MGNIPKSKGKEEILDEFGKLTGKVLEQNKINWYSKCEGGWIIPKII